MDADDPAISALLDAIHDAPRLRVVPVQVVTVLPLTVSVAGSDPVPARTLAGQTLSTGPASALWEPPSTPIVFATD